MVPSAKEELVTDRKRRLPHIEFLLERIALSGASYQDRPPASQLLKEWRDAWHLLHGHPALVPSSDHFMTAINQGFWNEAAYMMIPRGWYTYKVHHSRASYSITLNNFKRTNPRTNGRPTWRRHRYAVGTCTLETGQQARALMVAAMRAHLVNWLEELRQ